MAAARAQPADSDPSSDAQDALTDALLAAPNRTKPSAEVNLFPTAPGAEQQLPTSRTTLTVLAPLLLNTNAEGLSHGGTATAEGSPVVRLGWSSAAFDSHVRLSAAVGLETDRFVKSDGADFDKIRINLRAQYVNPNDDQAYTPFIAYVPRLDFDPTFAREFATRQDINLGVAKVFNFGDKFHRVHTGGNTSDDTVWSFGVSAFAQRRFRDPAPASTAIVLAPSASWFISDHWGFLLAVDFTQRWFDQNRGISRQDQMLEPIAVLEYALPESLFGGSSRAFGRPALDFQVALERNWSNVQGGTATIWWVGAALNTGWRL